MAIEIGPGWTIGGGISIVQPPSQATAGWYGGGGAPYVSTIQRITFATDTAVPSTRGPMTAVRYVLTGVGNLNYGWFAGGQLPPNTPRCYSLVDRVTYTTDTATATPKASLNNNNAYLASAGNTNYGWITGGWQYPTSPFTLSSVQRIDYSNDTTTPSVRGPLNAGRYQHSGTGSSDYGYFGGGSPFPLSSVERITYASDTGTASVRGPLSSSRYGSGASTDSTTYGWFGGGEAGYPGYGSFSTVDRITYATDTTTASVRGPLSLARYGMAATGNTSYGWFGGGQTYTPSALSSRVDRIDYSTDTATATARTSLTSALTGPGGASGVQ